MAEMEKLSQNSYWESHAISFKSERVKNLHVCYLFVVYYCNINTQGLYAGSSILIFL